MKTTSQNKEKLNKNSKFFQPLSSGDMELFLNKKEKKKKEKCRGKLRKSRHQKEEKRFCTTAHGSAT